MKKITTFLLSFILIICLSSCQQIKNTIKNLALTETERQIAVLTSDVVEKFLFKKDHIYDLNIYLYKDGSLENAGGIYGIDTKNKDKIILISGKRDESLSFTWNISSSGSIYKYLVIDIQDDRDFSMVKGIGNTSFIMEKSKEYILYFVAYVEGDSIKGSATEPFTIWDTIIDKENALTEFTYAYIITVQFSDAT